MGRICGCVGAECDFAKLSGLLSACYTISKPDPFEETVYLYSDAALGSEEKGSFFQTSDKRYSCIVDGKIFATQEILENISKDHPNLDPSWAAQVALYYYLSKGVDAFDKLPGGFVFALWDEEEKKLVLCRDRFGLKRIYYSNTSDGFVFASNLTGLVKWPAFNKKIDNNGFIEYMSFGFISPPYTIYKNASTLNPGEYLVLKDGEVQVEVFNPLVPDKWFFRDISEMSTEQLTGRIDTMFADSIKRRLPQVSQIGAYLSGGYDTSMVCAALKNHTDKNVTAFTLGSNDPDCDEVPQAHEIARHLGINDHQSYYITKDDFFEAIHAMPEVYGQPFADISAVPNYVIARNVAKEFKSVFAGDGPDFMYCGVDFRLWNRYYNIVPYLLRIPLSSILNFVANTFYKGWTSPNIHIKELLRQPEFSWIFHKKFKSCELDRLVNQKVDPKRFWVHNYLKERKDIPPYERFRLALFIAFGTHGVLYKGTGVHDAFNLDFICPYYDPELFDFVQFLPTECKFREKRGKYLHKQLLFKYVPRELLERPKQGFIINYNEFGLQTLRDLTGAYLTRERLDQTGLINADFALKCVENYYKGDSRMGPLLWTLLVFEMWRDKN